jgi:hypothetical protein
MMRAFAVGAIAGAGYMLADQFIPSTSGATKSGLLDKVINLAVAGVFGATAIHFLHKR